MSFITFCVTGWNGTKTICVKSIMYLEMEIESDMGMQLSTLLRIEWICLIQVQNILNNIKIIC